MMGVIENKQLMQNIFAELAQGNSRPLVEAMTEDFSWTVMGHNPWSRTYSGKQAVLRELLAPLSARIEGRAKLIAHRFIAEDDFVVVEARGSNTTKSGKPYNNMYCFVIRLAEGKMREITEYMDTELVTEALGDLSSAAS
jgi:ketosteroid isomerase-like protein